MCESNLAVVNYVKTLSNEDQLELYEDIVRAMRESGTNINAWSKITNEQVAEEMAKLNQLMAESTSSQHTSTLQGMKQALQNSRHGGKSTSRSFKRKHKKSKKQTRRRK